MSRMSLIDSNVWLSLTAERLNARAKTVDGGYPPYNVELFPAGERGPEILRITLAVAGFAREDLEVIVEDGALSIRGAKRDESPKDYLHRGIAARQFKRTFALANGVKVHRAELHDGLLTIELERPHREKRVRKVGIAQTR